MKRSRVTIVCANCKKRKIKCDRGEPCSQCTKGQMTCSYPTAKVERVTTTKKTESKLPYMSSAKNPLVFENPRKKAKQELLSTSLSELAQLKSRISQIETNLSSEGKTKSPEGNQNEIKFVPYEAAGASTQFIPSGGVNAAGTGKNQYPDSNRSQRELAPLNQSQVSLNQTGHRAIEHHTPLDTHTSLRYGHMPPVMSQFLSNNPPVGYETSESRKNSFTVPYQANTLGPHSSGHKPRSITEASNSNTSFAGSYTNNSVNPALATGVPSSTTHISNTRSHQPYQTGSLPLNPTAIGAPSYNGAREDTVGNISSHNNISSNSNYNLDNSRAAPYPANNTPTSYNHPSNSLRMYSDNGQNIHRPIVSNHLTEGLSAQENTTYPVNHSRPQMSSYTGNSSTLLTNNSPSIHLPPLKFSNSQHSAKVTGTEPSPSNSSNISSSFSPSMNSDATSRSLVSITSGIDLKSILGKLPYLDEDDAVNFFQGYTSIHAVGQRTINFGPFAWASIMKKDEGLSILWDSFHKRSDKLCILIGNTTNVSKEEKTFQSKVLLDAEDQDLVPYNTMKSPNTNTKVQTKKLNDTALSLGLTYYDGQLHRELELIEKIKVTLPNKKVLWKLIRRFFKWVYPYTPFIDEFIFVKETIKLLGPECYDEESISSLNVEKRIDLAHLGLLLIILRLSYLSLFTNNASINEKNLKSTDPSPIAQEHKYLMLNPINIDIFQVAQDCLDQFQILGRMSFQVLQLTLFIRLYNAYSPEEGDIADCEPQTTNGVLIQMAYSLGLNRDPDSFDDVLNDPRENNLRRKVWYFLILWDMFYACTLGNPMLSDSIYHDVKTPYYEPGNENISDASLDKTVTESFQKCALFLPKLKKLVSLMLSVNGKPKMSVMSPLLSELEVMISAEFRNLEDCLKPLESPAGIAAFARNLTVKTYLFLKTFFLTVYFYFYLHYDQKNTDLAYFYLKKILIISCDDIMPQYFNMLGDNKVLCDMIINPTLENMIHRANQMNFAFIIKANFKIHQMKILPDHGERFSNDQAYNEYFLACCELSSYITRCAEVNIAAISKLSNRYYQAWRITKGHTHILKAITTVDFYNENSKRGEGLVLTPLNLARVEELNYIIKSGLSKIDSREYNLSSVVAQSKNQGDFYKIYSEAKDLGETKETNVELNQTGFNSQPNCIFDDQAPPNPLGLDSLQSEDIDKLWMQMLSVKHGKQENNSVMHKSQDGKVGAQYPTADINQYLNDSSMSPTPIATFYDTSRGLGLENSDTFSDFPFDLMFKS